MARSTSIVMLLIFASISLSGCLFSNGEDGDIELIISYDSDFETIVETYSEGELVQTNLARFEFETFCINTGIDVIYCPIEDDREIG